MKKYYEINIAGCERKLPLCAVSDGLDIAAFIMFGDVEVTVRASEALLKKVPEFDVVVTPEAKSIPLAYELARQSGKPYIVARKGPKVYMTNPIVVEVKSITTEKVQHLYLGEDEVRLIKDHKVLIVDDVISTGESLKAVEELVEMSGGEIVGKAAVLAEGDASERDDIIFLEALPVFPK